MKSLGYLFSAILATIFSGYTLTILWDWFIIDKFNLPALDITEALGVLLVTKYLTLQLNFANADVEDYDFKLAYSMWLIPLFALLMGWIYTLFM